MNLNKEKNFVSAVIYVHNDAENIVFFLRQLNSILHQHFEKYEIICVNDASTDSSVQNIQNVAPELEGSIISIVHLSFYHGLESSMNAGIDLAIGDFVYEFDETHINYDLPVIMDTYLHLLTGFDIVAASSKENKLSSRLFYRLYNDHSNSLYKLDSETFRLLSRRAINRSHSMSKTIPYRKALYANCGLKMDTIIYTPTKSLQKTPSKVQNKMRQDTAVTSIILFTSIAYKAALFMTFLMMLATLAGGIYTLVVFVHKQPVAGYTSIMLILTGSFFGVFAIFAIIIKYLSLLVELVFMKQKYVFESIEKINS